MDALNASPWKNEDPIFASPELLWRAIVDTSDDAIISKDLNGIIKSWNKSAERIFGYTSDEMVGESILKLLPADRKEEETSILARLRKGERVDHYETVRVRKDGSLLDVSLTISPIKNESGQVIGASKIARNITEQKIAMRQLASVNEQLDRANRMKVDFISTLSHELRTPLNAILGWVQILRGNTDALELERGLETIERNVRAQSQMIEDLLDMSRIEAGKLTLDMLRLDLAVVVNAALETVRPTAETKGIRVGSAFSSVEGIVMGDKNRIQQVVWNLVTNAIKFTPKGGRVHVTVERVNSHVEIAVADNGSGIAPEFQEHIFERFSQADSTTTRKHSGLGLGLSIVKHLVELHGGTVRAKSPGTGQGATFIVCLPLVPLRYEKERTDSEKRNAEIDEKMVSPSLGGLRVLAVDDDPDSLEVIKRMLGRHGATVLTASSVDDAAAICLEHKPDILLSDIGMPNQDGYELISRIRQSPGGKSIPAVALTALARSEDRTRALRAGFQMHVAKPVDVSELVAVVKSLTDLK